MDGHVKRSFAKEFIIKEIVSILLILLAVSSALAHGPKGHGENDFTALEAAKKGIVLFDRLVATEKLSEAWETDMNKIDVFSRKVDAGEEIVVKISRSKGEPRSVYIFFTETGAYSGSNFTGN